MCGIHAQQDFSEGAGLGWEEIFNKKIFKKSHTRMRVLIAPSGESAACPTLVPGLRSDEGAGLKWGEEEFKLFLLLLIFLFQFWEF